MLRVIINARYTHELREKRDMLCDKKDSWYGHCRVNATKEVSVQMLLTSEV